MAIAPDTNLETTIDTSRKGWASLRDLTEYQWFVFVVAAVAWMADCMDQQLFNLARVMSLTDLLGGALADKAEVTKWSGRSTSVFLVGWATGGLVFGMYGDRIGRVKTLTYTILLYSIFTGLALFHRGHTTTVPIGSSRDLVLVESLRQLSPSSLRQCQIAPDHSRSVSCKRFRQLGTARRHSYSSRLACSN